MKFKQFAAVLGLTLGAGVLQAAPFQECPTQAFLMQDRIAKLYGVDLSTGYYEFLAESLQTPERINGVGFNTFDNYLYGWGYEERTLVRIGDDYTAEFIPLADNGVIPANSTFYVGDVALNENAYYFYRKNSSHGLFKVSLDPESALYLQPERIVNGSQLELRIYDLAFSPIDNFMYSVDRNGLLQRIDPSNGSLETLAQLNVSGTFGAVYFDATGALYISRNNDGHIFRLDPLAENPNAQLFAYGPKSGQNDGARCAFAPPVAPNAPTTDYGQAPDTYGTLFASNGARHNIIPNVIQLGSGVDAEEDAYPFPLQDDLVRDGEDDGVQFVSAITAGEQAVLKVTSSAAGVLNGFFDWNRNGVFDESEATGDLAVLAGEQFIYIDVPFDASSGDTWSRFRISRAGGLGATAGAPDGEVEDYPINILPCECSISYYPSQDDVVTLAYEDLWPLKGDYDMNDMVLYYSTEVISSGSNIFAVRLKGELVAVGASFHNGFAVRLEGVARSNIDQNNVVFKVNDVPVNRDAIEAGRSEAIVVVTNDIWDDIVPMDTCGFYRTQLPCDEPIQWSFEIYVPFDSPVPDTTFESYLFDPFLFGTTGFARNADFSPEQGRGLEVHLKNKAFTEASETALFGRANDRTIPEQELYYLRANGLPFALEIGTRWKHPLEGVEIIEAYPDFINYVLSGGTENKDWYLEENADSTKIYPH